MTTSQLIRVMTWNIRTGVGNDPAEPGRLAASDLERVARVISAIQPDVVALQEVDRNRDRTAFVDQSAELATLLGMDARFAPNLVDEAGEYGLATLSSHPVVASEHVLFPPMDGWEPRGLLDVVVDVGGLHIRVLNTHLQVGEGADARMQREDSAHSLALRMRRSSEPVVLMGDFNADPASPELAPLAFAVDAWADKREEGEGFTIPASPFSDPKQRIDAIYADRRFLVRGCAVIRNGETQLASDHYPVVADLLLVT